MTKEETKILLEMSTQLGELHGALYKNGFLGRINNMESNISKMKKHLVILWIVTIGSLSSLQLLGPDFFIKVLAKIGLGL